jgi:fructose-1-phosphate kinase PfkB-like protein
MLFDKSLTRGDFLIYTFTFSPSIDLSMNINKIIKGDTNCSSK